MNNFESQIYTLENFYLKFIIMFPIYFLIDMFWHALNCKY